MSTTLDPTGSPFNTNSAPDPAAGGGTTVEGGEVKAGQTVTAVAPGQPGGTAGLNFDVGSKIYYPNTGVTFEKTGTGTWAPLGANGQPLTGQELNNFLTNYNTTYPSQPAPTTGPSLVPGGQPIDEICAMDPRISSPGFDGGPKSTGGNGQYIPLPNDSPSAPPIRT